MNNLLIFFPVILFAKHDVISDCIVNDPRLLSDQTHTSIDSNSWSFLGQRELHLS